MDNYMPRLYCPKHKAEMQRKGDKFKCCIEGCTHKAILKGNIIDCIGERTSDQWNNVFAGDTKVGQLKNVFDKIVRWLAGNVITDYAFKYISENYPPGSKLIEMGCGEASASIRLGNVNEYYIALVEKNDNVLRLLNSRLSSVDWNINCAVVKADWYAENLPFASKQFDISFNIGTIEHFEDPVKAVLEMRRIASQVLCVVPAPSIYWKIATLVRRLVEKDASIWTEGTRYYTRDSLKNIFRQAGFGNIKTCQTTLFGLPVMNNVIGYD